MITIKIETAINVLDGSTEYEVYHKFPNKKGEVKTGLSKNGALNLSTKLIEQALQIKPSGYRYIIG